MDHSYTLLYKYPFINKISIPTNQHADLVEKTSEIEWLS